MSMFVQRLLPLAFEVLLLGLALFKVTDYWKQHGMRGSRLLFVLVKDQVLYFMSSVREISAGNQLLMLSRAICVAVFVIAEDETSTSLVPSAILGALGTPTLLCLLGSRMFFNLKEAAEHGVNVGTNWSSHSQSSIGFDEHRSRASQYVTFDLIPFLALMKFKRSTEAGERTIELQGVERCVTNINLSKQLLISRCFSGSKTLKPRSVRSTLEELMDRSQSGTTLLTLTIALARVYISKFFLSHSYWSTSPAQCGTRCRLRVDSQTI